MATPTLKSTYSLDLETLRTLERLANRWRVSKSEALRRAIRAAAQLPSTGSDDALRALDSLQRSLGLGRAAAGQWAEAARAERRASSRRLVRGRR
jgi:hypothetical protein